MEQKDFLIVPEITNDLCNVWYTPIAINSYQNVSLCLSASFMGLQQSIIHAEQNEGSFSFKCIMNFSNLINFSF